MKRTGLILAVFLVFAGGLMSAQSPEPTPAPQTAQELQTITLPPAALQNDKPFMQAIKERKSSRDFSEKALSLQDLSNVVWCANGINRPETGQRTSPSAMNRQDIDVYAVLKEGIYLYEAKKHQLVPVLSGDYRKNTGMQDFVGTAPLNLVYVSDTSKLGSGGDRENMVMTAAIDAGHCSQNVYLYGAAANLAVVVRGYIDKAKMAEIMKLKPEQMIIIAQTVGYPKSSSDQK
jgi:SagB-type dehydrogenase family enzyme